MRVLSQQRDESVFLCEQRHGWLLGVRGRGRGGGAGFQGPSGGAGPLTSVLQNGCGGGGAGGLVLWAIMG